MISLNPSKLNRCDWYILLWVIYYLQGIAYSEGGIISIGLLGIIVLISLKYFVKVLCDRNNPIFFKGLNLLVILLTIYGLSYIVLNPSTIKYPIPGISIASNSYLKSIYISLLPIYPFYYYSKKGYLTSRSLQVWGCVFLISVLLSYFRTQQEVLQKMMELGSHREEITNNSGYLFLSLIPLIVLYRRKPLIQFIGLAVVMLFIVLGMKRGAIIIGAIVSIYFMAQAIKNSHGKTKKIIITLSVLICLGVVYFFMDMMANSDYMMQRINDTMEGNTSARDNLYSYFWTYFTEKADFTHYLFGRGANGTLEIYYNYAHNDWLEIAVNQGLFGVVIYAIYWISFYRTWRQTKNIEAKTIIAITMIIYFTKTLFSMSYGDMSYVSTCALGYALATVNKPNTQQ